MGRLFFRTGVRLAQKNCRFFFVWKLVLVGEAIIELPFFVDKYRCIFGFVVALVAFCVLNFREGYMPHDKYYVRFHLILSLFVLSMYFLIFSPRMIRIFLGWDGLGVVSYFLVIYFDNKKSFNAGLLTALRNRVGDIMFILRLLFFLEFRSWNFFCWSSSLFRESALGVLVILMIGCCTKRAQVPFSAWLPAAMAAPTPVSALVHSSTLVTAGVYVLFRFREMFSLSGINDVLFLMGRATMVLAGFSALKEIDAKKIVALSTLSQLGIMMIRLGAQNYAAAFFHLLSHAFFKALLFIVVGNIIYMTKGYQDLRKMRCRYLGCKESLVLGRIRNFSLIGLPFFSGFYSKDYCIEINLARSRGITGKFIFVLRIVLTVLYSIRFSKVGFGLANSQTSLFIVEKTDKIIRGRYILVLGGVAGGRFLRWYLFDASFFFLDRSFKILVLIVLISSLFVGRVIGRLKLGYGKLEGLFYMWNLGYIRGAIPGKGGLSKALLNTTNLEIKWLSSRFWRYRLGQRRLKVGYTGERYKVWGRIMMFLLGALLIYLV